MFYRRFEMRYLHPYPKNFNINTVKSKAKGPVIFLCSLWIYGAMLLLKKKNFQQFLMHFAIFK